jgi:F-type H+-transporting ATPase subunit b
VVIGSSNFLVPNGTFIVELIAFLLVLFILGRYILPYISKPMEERQAAIRQALLDAEEAKRRAAEAEEEYKRVLGEARTQAREVVDEAGKTAELLRTEKRHQADREYEQRVAQASADIEAQTRRASEELRRQAADLVITVTERVIGEGMDTPAQRGLIDRTIAEVEAQNGRAEMSR